MGRIKNGSLFTSLSFHFTFTFTSLHKHGKKRSIAGTAQHSTKYSTCKTSAGVKKKFLHFYKRNPFKFFLKSPSIFKRNPIKKIAFNFIWKIPCKLFTNHKLDHF